MPKPLLSKALLLLLLLTPGKILLSKGPAPEPCDGVQLKIDVTKSEFPGKGDAEAVVTGAEKPIYYIFL